MELYNFTHIKRELSFFSNELKKAKIQDRYFIQENQENQLNDYLSRLNRFHKNESLNCENYLSSLFEKYDQNELYSFISTRQFLINIVSYSDFDVEAVSKFIVDFYSFYDTKDFKTNTKVIFDIQLKNISGDTKKQKIRKLVDFKYISKLVWNNFISYKDTYLINKSFKKKEKANVVSRFGAEIISKKIQQQEKFLSNRKLIKNNQPILKTDGTELTLLDIHKEKSKNRLSEIVAIQKSFEQISKDLGYTFLFTTITCPANFKPSPENGNISYTKGTMVKDGINLLNEVFTYVRKRKNDILSKSPKTPAALKHLDFFADFYGLWSKEPQQDGTPHSHFLIYCHPSDLQKYQELFTYAVQHIFEKHGLKFDKDNSCKHIVQDEKQTKNPAAYIFKYIFKCLNISKNEEQKEQNELSLYHFSLHKYRRYDFFGVDKILTVWREFKRMIAFDKNSTQFNHFKDIAKVLGKEDKINFYKLYNYCKLNKVKEFTEILSKSNIQKLYKITEKELKFKIIEIENLKPEQEIKFTKCLRGLKIFNLDIELRFFKII
jgi:hypothetical protein